MRARRTSRSPRRPDPRLSMVLAVRRCRLPRAAFSPRHRNDDRERGFLGPFRNASGAAAALEVPAARWGAHVGYPGAGARASIVAERRTHGGRPRRRQRTSRIGAGTALVASWNTVRRTARSGSSLHLTRRRPSLSHRPTPALPRTRLADLLADGKSASWPSVRDVALNGSTWWSLRSSRSRGRTSSA